MEWEEEKRNRTDRKPCRVDDASRRRANTHRVLEMDWSREQIPLASGRRRSGKRENRKSPPEGQRAPARREGARVRLRAASNWRKAGWPRHSKERTRFAR